MIRVRCSFHSRLAVRFWDALERARTDLQFVYVTHDLAFALSRHQARYVLIRPNQPPQVLAVDEELPHDIARSVLSAASFSVYAERIIFCEGTESGPDFRFLTAWAKDRRTSIVPVGSCSDVLRCRHVFNNSALVAGVSAEGVIGRGYWPSTFLANLPSGVFALPVHEIESLYCRPGVVRSVARHIGKNAEDVMANIIADMRTKCGDAAFVHKQALERTKARVEPFLTALFSEVK